MQGFKTRNLLNCTAFSGCRTPFVNYQKKSHQSQKISLNLAPGNGYIQSPYGKTKEGKKSKYFQPAETL
jgi:hypothetical protein